MSGKSETYKNAKNKILKRGCSVTELKGELRRQYRNRIKEIRNTVQDCNRTLDIVKQGYEEMYTKLYSEIEEQELLDPSTVFQVLNEVEKEMLEEETQKLGEDYEKQLKTETDAIVENLFTCKACDIVLNSNENDICFKCANTYFNN